VIDSLYLVLDRPRRLVANICKISFLVEVETLRCLNKYFFKERKYNNILERDALKIINICSESLMVYL
jgi:hypothetical protein